MLGNNRIKRHKRIRSKLSGTSTRPRLSVYRSSKHMQVQLIDDVNRVTLAGLSTKAVANSKLTKTQESTELGVKFAEMVKNKYSKIVFDRGGYKFHGRIKALADSLRSNGLEF